MPLLGIYAFSQYTHGVPAGDLTGDTHPNDPASPGYTETAYSWIGEDFTYNGGGPTQVSLFDDDGNFEDGYVETGAAQTLDQPATIGGTTYPIGAVVENEFALVNASGQEIYVVRIDGVNVGFTYRTGEEPTTGEVFTAATGLDGDPVDNADGVSSSQEPYTGVVCFAAGMMIDTPHGLRAVDTLRPGDLVHTFSDGPQPVMWTNSQSVVFDARGDQHRPVRFRAGSLGPNMPHAALIVSPQHRILIDSPHARALFGTDRVLVPAKALDVLTGVRIMRGVRRVAYHHFALPRHAVVCAMGAPAETFYPGRTGCKTLDAPAIQRLHKAFPDLADAATGTDNVPGRSAAPAHRLLNVGEGRCLARRIKADIAVTGAATFPDPVSERPASAKLART